MIKSVSAGLVILVYLSLIVGWIGNIVQIVTHINEPVTTLFVLKCVGILAAPLGSILGLIGFF